MTNTARTIAILTKALARIADPKDWGQGSRPSRINPKSCCASEAIAESADAGADRKAAYDALSKAIGTTRIVDWNDDPVRRWADLPAAFVRAIDSLGGRSP